MNTRYASLLLLSALSFQLKAARISDLEYASYIALPPASPEMPPPPSNDMCSSVTPASLAVGGSLTFTGDNTGATFAGDAVSGPIFDVGLPCVWHGFTTTECANVTIDLCGTTPVWTSVYHFLTTTCPADANVVNATDFNNSDCVDGSQSIHFIALPAGTYYIPVLLNVFAEFGPYTMHVGAASCGGGVPANDLCSSVTPQALAVGTPINFSGNNTNATLAGDAVAGTLIDQVGLPCVWHSFTTTECTNVTMDLCGATPAWTNVYHLLATTCPADNNLINANDFNTTDCVDGNQTIHYNALPAGTYYVPIIYDVFSQYGAYTMHVSAVACGGGVPVNDLCSSVTPQALAINATINFSGNNTNATLAGDAVPGTLIDQVGLPCVWHAFTTTECADVTMDLCGATPAWTNVYHLLATTCPADNNLINANDFNTTTCVDGNQTIHYIGLPAGTYYVPLLYDAFGQNGAYTMHVHAGLCANAPPVNDLCTSVTAVTIAMGTTTTFTGNSINATSTGDAVPGTLIDQVGLPNVWHEFTIAECADVTVNYCATDTNFHTVWSILATTCPANNNLVPATSSDSTSCANGNQTNFYNNLPAGTYYLPVLMNPFNNTVGPYSIDVQAVVCDSSSCDGGLVSVTGDGTSALVCADLAADVISFSTNSVSASSFAYVITDASENIISVLAGNTHDFNADPLGVYHVYGVSYMGSLTGTGAGSPISGVGATGGCRDLSTDNVTVTVEICVGIAVHNAEAWSVFPNPTTGTLFIQNDGAVCDATIDLIDIAGRVVLNERITMGHGAVHTFGTEGHLAVGTYTLRFTTEAGRTEQRIVVQ